MLDRQSNRPSAQRRPLFGRNRVLKALLALVSAALFCSCQPATKNEELSLKLGYVPSEITVSDRQAAFEALRGHLQDQLKIPVELIQTAAYEPAINAMKAGEIDILNFGGSHAYLIAERAGYAEAFAARGDPDGKPRTYEGLVLTSANKPWTSIDDALDHKGKLKVLYTNEASTSGYLIARSYFRSRGIDPDRDFASTDFSNSHVLSVLYASQGRYDLIAVSSTLLGDLIRQDKVDPESVRILWKSEPIASGPVAFRPDLDNDLKQLVRDAYFTAHKADPAVWEQILAQSPERPFVYIPANSESFAGLRSLIP